MSTTLLGTKPYLTLYIKVARSCKRRFCRLGRLARLRRLEYSTECVLYTILRARSYTLSTFLASEALQKCHIRWQYVKYGNIEDLYESNFVSVGIRFLNLEGTPTLWLAFIHNSLICLLNTRCSSMLTPRRLMSALLSMTCALIMKRDPYHSVSWSSATGIKSGPLALAEPRVLTHALVVSQAKVLMWRKVGRG